MKNILLLAALAALTFTSTCAQEIQGAAKALERLAAQTAAGGAAAQQPGAAWRAQLTALQKEAATLAPEVAAARWLALFEAYAALPAEERENRSRQRYDEPQGAAQLVLALPPPAAWEALSQRVGALPADASPLRAASLRLLVATLRGDAGTSARARGELRQSAAEDKAQGAALIPLLEAFENVAATLSGDAREIVAQFEKRLAACENDLDVSSLEPGDSEVPDLVTLAGAAQAEALLRRALVLDTKLQIERGDATKELAAKLALELVAKLRHALWSLVRTPRDMPLYEALAKKFPPNREGSDYRDASLVYLVGLIAAKRTDQATQMALALGAQENSGRSLPSNAIESLVAAGRGKEVLAFLHALLQGHPELTFWDDLIPLAARLGSADAALALVRRALARDGLEESTRTSLRAHLRSALFAAGDVEAGVKLLREALQTDAPKIPAATQNAIDRLQRSGRHVRFRSRDEGEDRETLALQLIRLGRLLERPEWIEEGVQSGLAAVKAAEGNDGSEAGELARELVELGRLAQAEDLLIHHLLVFAKRQQREVSRYEVPPLASLQHPLGNMAAFYHRMDRPQDVLALLDGSKNWGAGDLAVADRSTNGFQIPLTYIAADALAATGREAEARRVLDACLEQHGGYDPAYALLLQLGGDDVPARLDALHARDRFEERPLIWKARLQLLEEEIVNAEKTIRAAIAIDPSDGEQGKGHRMRAYGVLADVLEKKGDDADAAKMRGAVAAIRLSETADDWWTAGLLSRAVAMYEEALKLFADAYCVQSRLALRYAELGNEAKALEHYRRAYELMPDSFGRMESHCFGCEGAFNGDRAQALADKIFTELALKMPGKPQVFYLLGYLREQQDRHAEALAEFRRAVQLDPDYLNAWEHLAGLDESLVLPPADRDAAALNLLRLDPLGRHSSPDLEKVSDLGALWKAVAAALAQRPPTRRAAYPLAASRAAIEAAIKASPQAAGNAGDLDAMLLNDHRSGVAAIRSPGAALAQHALLQALAPLLEFAGTIE